MLTKLTVRNFKRFDEVEIELGQTVVLIGPNNSGKTTALQALAIWHLGVQRWNEKRAGRATPGKRPGVTISRRDILAVPVPEANLLWREMKVRDVQRPNGQQQTQNIRFEIVVDGVSNQSSWTCGMEFDYANAEFLHCRPLRVAGDPAKRMEVPQAAVEMPVVFLPPMSGLTSNEIKLDPGAIDVRLGEGRTAEVLRNICYRLATEQKSRWDEVVSEIKRLFGTSLNAPVYVSERGELSMSYAEPHGTTLDISSAGRGMQQTLLLLAYLGVNPRSTILLDEPDAHLEILRQRQIYNLLTETASRLNCQVIAASHSEVVLNEAAGRDVVVAFVGKPHRIDDRGSQLLKSLREIGYEQYYQAEQTGWVLYLEGSTDLSILQQFARTLGHGASECLERPFVHPVSNQPKKVEDHFYGLREATRNLVGFALFDRLERSLPSPAASLIFHQWSRREIENYLCSRETLVKWARGFGEEQSVPLLTSDWEQIMEETITEISDALGKLGKDPWSPDIKVTDEFLDPLFKQFFKAVKMPSLFNKAQYHGLARYVSLSQIDDEVRLVLDRIVETARRATPLR